MASTIRSRAGGACRRRPGSRRGRARFPGRLSRACSGRVRAPRARGRPAPLRASQRRGHARATTRPSYARRAPGRHSQLPAVLWQRFAPFTSGPARQVNSPPATSNRSCSSSASAERANTQPANPCAGPMNCSTMPLSCCVQRFVSGSHSRRNQAALSRQSSSQRASGSARASRGRQASCRGCPTSTPAARLGRSPQ